MTLSGFQCTSNTISPQAVNHDIKLNVTAAGKENAPKDVANPPNLRVRSGQLEVLGLMSTPNPCYDLRAKLIQRNKELNIIIEADPKQVMCIQVMGEFAYQLVEKVNPGSYHLSVTYHYPKTGWQERQVLQQNIIIPE